MLVPRSTYLVSCKVQGVGWRMKRISASNKDGAMSVMCEYQALIFGVSRKDIVEGLATKLGDSAMWRE